MDSTPVEPPISEGGCLFVLANHKLSTKSHEKEEISVLGYLRRAQAGFGPSRLDLATAQARVRDLGRDDESFENEMTGRLLGR
jgi:hypothetical protein